MKLAWKELKHNKGKYLMVEAILILMIFMVLFLSGLANGLGRAVSAGIENEDAAYYVVSEGAEQMITISDLSAEQVEEIKASTQDETATLDIQRMNLKKADSETKLDVTYFAMDGEGFLMPVVTEGESFTTAEDGIVLDDSFKDEGIQIGDKLEDAATGVTVTVTGFVHGEYYGHSSIGFLSVETYTKIRKEINPAYVTSYHTVAIRGKDIQNINMEGVEVVDKHTIIQNIPGYSAEQITINMIIWVLVVISAAILGVFFYVLTIQKQKQFGVLKAIGMHMRELVTMIVSQVAMLACIGMVIGNLLVWGMSMVLPSAMPFYLKGQDAAIISAAFIVISIVCSLISTRKVAKVDPIVTIGGNE